ncbi:hypothetical protein, partial [Streptomyces sp. Ru71]|uniref:hypothetical protein n=1 Tax=Streptomyces sp. Ru71 TaxID=2080746 RepID=UPI001CA4B2FF
CVGDPVNCYDLDGRWSFRMPRGAGRWFSKGWGYVKQGGRWLSRKARAANWAAKARVGRWISNRYNHGRSRVSIDGAKGRWHYDLWGKTHGGVRTPHKVYQPRNSRAPHGWGKTERRAHSMGWGDLYRVWRYLR